jgi:uncharacterized membrane protein
MALFIRQDEQRTKLQERLAAELRAKAKARSDLDAGLPDGVEDSDYLKDTKSTTSLAWVWILVVVLAVAGLIFVMMQPAA